MILSIFFLLLPLAAVATLLTVVWYLVEPGDPQYQGFERRSLAQPDIRDPWTVRSNEGLRGGSVASR